MPTRVIASSFALIAFALAIVMGLYVGNEAIAILSRALLVMFISYWVGMCVGAVGHRAIQEHLNRYRLDNPIPRLDDNHDIISGTDAASEHAALSSQEATGDSTAELTPQPNAA